MRRFLLTTVVLGSLHLAGLAFFASSAQCPGVEGTAQAQPQVAQPAQAAPVRASSFQVGEPAFIEWNGSWWPAKVRAVKKDGWAIRYDNYGPEWDETVGPSRIRVLR